jgi:very-short-patch-repair endonuclease
MLWRAARLIVELDGSDAHSTPAQLGADARRRAELERRGFTVLRITAARMTDQRERIAADLRRRFGSAVQAGR